MFFPSQASYVNMPLHVKPTYVQQWNLSVQRQIGADWLLSGSYIGNHTVHLWSSTQSNPAIYVAGNSTTANTDARRLLTFINPVEGPKYQGFYQLDDGASASYNALLLSVQRRMAKGVTVLANYTWSHCIAEAVDSVLGTTANYMDPNNRRADRGSCLPSDRRQLLNLSAVAMTPKFSDRILRLAASDWRVGAIVALRPAAPST